MKKKLYLTLPVLFCVVLTSHLFAQGAREVQIKFIKGQQQNAIIADYDFSPNTIAGALQQRMERMLGSSHSEKGYTTYKGVNWPEISPDKVDVYVKVEGRSNKSTVTLLISKGYDNFITTATDADKVQKAEAFLNGFVKDAALYQLRQGIADQEEVVKKADKAVGNANDDGARLLHDREKIEKKIAENDTEKARLQGIADTEHKKLDDMKRQVGQ